MNANDIPSTFLLRAGRKLTVAMDAASTSLVQRLSGGTELDRKALAASESGVFGPYEGDVGFRVSCLTGTLTITESDGSTLEAASQQLTLSSGLFAAPADSTPFYFGGLPGSAPGTTAARQKYSFTKAGVITLAQLAIAVQGTLGTTETATVAIRLNDTTDYTVTASAKHDAVHQTYSSGNLSIPIAVGDFIEVKVTPPAWATNPTNVYYTVQLKFSA